MKYRVPLYKLVDTGSRKIGNITVNYTSLGAYENNSNMKIHISMGAFTRLPVSPISQRLVNPYVKKEDFNTSNLVKEKFICKKKY